RGEHHLDAGGHTHLVKLLLPGARAHRVVHQHDESHVERFPPADHDLAVDQAVVDAVQRDAHAAGVRIARLPASAARRAASAGGRSRWNTKSSSIARFTPVTTAMSDLPRASRTELVRHEPPGRSTNRTAGLPAIACVRRSASAPVSQPSFDTGTSASSTPVIAATAASSAWATAACDTITPRNGSLIVLLEILLQLAALREALEEPVVEGARRVHAAVAEQVVHRHDLADHGQVLAGVERDRDHREGHVEHARRLTVDPGAVVLARRVPLVELHHDLDALLLPHRPHAEQGADVDESDAADLHVVLRQLVAAADQDVVAAPRDVDDVVRDQAVAALDQVEHAFALADPGLAEEQQAHAEHVGERRVHAGARREHVVQEGLEAAVELRALEPATADGDTLGAGQLHQVGGRLLALGDHHARQIEREQRLERAAARGGI